MLDSITLRILIKFDYVYIKTIVLAFCNGAILSLVTIFLSPWNEEQEAYRSFSISEFGQNPIIRPKGVSF